MGAEMWRCLACAFVSILVGMAAVTASRAQGSQRICWPQTKFSKEQKFQVVAVAEIVLTASFNADTPVNVISPIEPKGLKKVQLTTASGKLIDASGQHLLTEPGQAYYEVGQAILGLVARTEIEIDTTKINLTNGILPAGSSGRLKLAKGDRLNVELLGENASLTRAADLGSDYLRPEFLPTATPPRTIKAKAIKIGAGVNAAKTNLLACIRNGDTWVRAPIEKVISTEDSADITVALPDTLGWGKNTLAVMFDDGKFVGHGSFWIVPTWIAGLVALVVVVLGHFLTWGLVILEIANSGRDICLAERL